MVAHSLKMNYSISFVLILLYCLLHVTRIKAQFSCDNNYGNFTAGSSYGHNRDLILTSLYTNSTANGGFYSGNIGTGNSTVYVLSYCRGDSTREQCAACLNSTALDLIQQCPNQKKAVSWGQVAPPCIIRYSDSPIYGTYEARPILMFYNTGNITMNQTEFDNIWLNLTSNLAVEASKGSLELKYAAGETLLPDFKMIFALLQCSPDMSETYCRSCLSSSIGDYQNCCHGKQGGAILKPSCFFRWDLYPFYASSTPPPPAVQSPPTASPPHSISPNTTEVNTGKSNSSIRIILMATAVAVGSVILIICILVIMKKRRDGKQMERLPSVYLDDISEEESLQFDLEAVKAATRNFSDVNKLGRGGFGTVYKGTLPNGKEIAVKRLSSNSLQGVLEFKNEVMFLAKLQHRNLVRLLGFCLEGIEKLLIYEFVPNSSLDNFIFDPAKSRLLNWESRRKIITGTARGLLYLHEDSRLRIIHRDLKASNILLDEDMNPKISDFGMAKLFSQDQTRADTSRIVGTYGYMAPEYLMRGNFSVKIDVFSFGVLVLEIVSGRRNNNVQDGDNVETLLSYAWKNWREGTLSNIIDPSLHSSLTTEIARCIHIALLCVQENVASRPTMASVVMMLSSHSLSLQVPSPPAFVLHGGAEFDTSAANEYSQDFSNSYGTRSNLSRDVSRNDVSITDLYPR